MTEPTAAPSGPTNDMRELYALQHAITDAGGAMAPGVHKAIDALREVWDRELRRAQAEAHQYRTALQGAARAAVPAGQAPATDQTALRDRIGAEMARADGWDWAGAVFSTLDTPGANRYRKLADAVLSVLPASVDRAADAERPLSPDYEHPECGFHWHGRDGMDIPMRDGQPVCPRCEIERLHEKHKAGLRRADQINNELMEEVQRYADGTERPVLWSVYNEMHLRAADAELALDRIREVVRRLAAHAVGFQDVLDESDRGPWGKTVSADIAELRRLAAPSAVVVRRATDETPGEARPDEPLTIRYRNHRGETGNRAVLPARVWFGATEWHPEPQWLLRAFDIDRNADRDFALADMQGIGMAPREPAVGAQHLVCKCPAEICQCGHHQAQQPKEA